MNKEIADKWVAALKSGKYSQGSEYLRYKEYDGEDVFCAIGVLYDVIDPTGWKKIPTGGYPQSEYTFLTRNGHENSMDEDTFKECGFNGNYEDENSATDKIYNMNDAERCSFTEIAEYIEQNWEKL